MKETKIVSYHVEKEIAEEFHDTIERLNFTAKRGIKKIIKGHVVEDFMTKFINKNKPKND